METIREQEDPSLSHSADSTRAIARLSLVLRLLSPWQRLKFLCLVAERILLGLCDLLLAAAMYLLFERLQGGESVHQHLWSPATALSTTYWTIGIVVVRLLLDLSVSRSATRFTQGLYAELLLRLTRGYGELRWNRFVERNRSELIKHSMATALDAAYSYQIYLEVASGLIVIIVMSAALVYKSPVATACLACIVILLYLLHRTVLRNRLQDAARDREQAIRKLQHILTDVLSASKEIRAYGNQEFFYGRLRDQADILGLNNVRLAFLPQISRVLAEQGVVLLFLGVILTVLWRAGNVHSILSLLLFYFVVSRRMLPLISQVVLLNGQLEGAYENLQITYQELHDCELNRGALSQELEPEPGYTLQLADVSYVFDNGTVVLDGVTLDLHVGETVLLRGVSGSGKSSLLNLVAGVSSPSSGSIRVNRSDVAYVPQEIALLDDSVRNNLLFGLAAKPDDVLLEALGTANLRSFVEGLPEGLQTRVGDSGILLSGGQRQRLGLARAALREVSLLVLDEATSALDEENEREILAKLAASNRTVLLVTHRRHRSDVANRTFELQDGKLLSSSISHSTVDKLVSRS
jgi:ABC-type multidrug transport system fused ATPase/permease subunit